jgi:hypothetical protein
MKTLEQLSDRLIALAKDGQHDEDREALVAGASALLHAERAGSVTSKGIREYTRRAFEAMGWPLLLVVALSACTSSVELPAESAEALVGYAAIGTDGPPVRAEYYTWRITEGVEIETHIPGCVIEIGTLQRGVGDDWLGGANLTDPTECVVLGPAVHDLGEYPEPEIWSFGRGYVDYDDEGNPSWYGTSLERTGRPVAGVSFHTGREVEP